MVHDVYLLIGKTLLVVMDETPDQTTVGGIVLPGSGDRSPFVTAQVVMLGEGIEFDDPSKALTDSCLGILESEILHARVLFPRNAGSLLDKVDGKERRVIPMGAVVGIVEP